MTQALAAGCDILIHEAYGFEDSVPGHGSISSCLDIARNCGTKRLALVHMQRNVRVQCADIIANVQREFVDIEIMIPEKGSIISV